MSKRIIIGQAAWGVDDSNVESVVAQLKEAMADESVAALELLDSDKRPVTVYVNTKLVPTVVVDLDLDQGPRPTEISR